MLPIGLVALACAACGGGSPPADKPGASVEPPADEQPTEQATEQPAEQASAQPAAQPAVPPVKPTHPRPDDEWLADVPRAGSKHKVAELGIDGELLQAAKQGDLEEVKRLLAAGAKLEAVHYHDPWDPSPFRSGYTPLAYAAFGGHFELLEHLLAAGAEQSEWVLIAAAEGNQLEMVKRLLKLKAFKKKKVRTTAMVRACTEEHPQIVEYLVKHGANVNGRAHGWEVEMTCLTVAAAGEDLKLVKFAVDLGASVDVGDETRMTPLMYAAERCNVELVNYLLQKRAQVNKKTKEGETALDYARHEECAAVEKLLLSKGARAGSGGD
jgi:ankyrin repeat protein